jgi:hypothetical protein
MPIQRITSRVIEDGIIAAADIADGSITTAKIADANITSAKIVSVANTKITGNIISSQITSVSNTQITGNITASQITSVSNTQISGLITDTQLANTAVTAGTYGGSSNVSSFTVDSRGRITSVSNVAISAGGGTEPPKITVFNAPGTFTKNVSTKYVVVQVRSGAGGGGGGFASSSGVQEVLEDQYRLDHLHLQRVVMVVMVVPDSSLLVIQEQLDHLHPALQPLL